MQPDRDAIAEAVRRAESLTAGEIVVVIDRAASSYRNVPAMLALTLALFVPWPLLCADGDERAAHIPDPADLRSRAAVGELCSGMVVAGASCPASSSAGGRMTWRCGNSRRAG